MGKEASSLLSDFVIESHKALMEEAGRLFREFAAARDEGYIWHFCILPEDSEAKRRALNTANIHHKIITCSKRHWLLVKEEDVDRAEKIL